MIAEIILAVILSFGVGTGLGIYSGKEQAKKEKPIQLRQPDVWEADKHKEMLKVCAMSCGRENMKEYDIVYGRCVCDTGKVRSK